ncbi:MAG: AAA family ATPase [Roseburia sp.]|nr:AAA family ATPase [Roseburia sp.]
MKPICLEMSAFGSYGGVEKVDFSEKQEGLFLITGDTGAGKTTVFDAMMYALYGKTSGGARDGSMMRSHYAGRDVKTYVIFKFSFQGREYQITRNPEYQIEKILKNGKVKQQKVAQGLELLLPEGVVFSGKKSEVEERIQEIVGLTPEQFTQMAMIAQGDFLKLIYAKTDERKKIFSHLFGTGIYSDIAEALKRYAAELEDKIRSKNQAVEQEYARKVLPMGFEDDERDMEEGHAGKLLILDGYIAFGREREREVGKTLAECKNARQKLLEQITRAQAAEKLFHAYEKALKQQQSLEDRREEILATERRIRRGEAAEKVWQEEQKVTDEKKNLEENLKRKQELKDKEKILRKSLEVSELAEIWIENRRKNFLLELLSEDLALCLRQREKTEKKKEIWQKLVEESLAKRNVYEEKYAVFLREQAGILAKDLTEGEPCPVCGSKEHPCKARLSNEAVSQLEVEEARKARDLAETKREQAQQKYRLEEQNLQQMWQQLADQGKKLLGGELSAEELQDNIPEEQASLRKQAEGYEARLLESEYWKEFLDQIKDCTKTDRQKGMSFFEKMREEAQGYIRQMAEEKSRNAGNLEAVEKEEKKLLDGIKKQEALFLQTRKRSGFEDEISYRQAISTEKEREKWKGEILSYRKEMDEKEGEIRGLKSQLKGKKQEDTEKLEIREKELKQQIKELENQKMDCYAANETNRKVRQNLISFENESKMLREEAAVAGSLARTAGGRLSQSAKMDLETYVQRRYFKQIIAQANKRFIPMTGKQFMLRIKEEPVGKGKNEGLDLMVYAIATGTLRDIRTLSGGESFLAALSMALGLSDIVMKQSGGIRLDMMFIDEGFGSLDEESRKKAIEVLQELSVGHRLIGIISHVTELKEQLDHKLCVTRNEKGSSVCWEIS